MAQLRLRNNTGSTSRIGQLVKLDPKNPKAFVNVTDLTTLPVIGTVASAVPSGNVALINVIGGYNTNPSGGLLIISPTEPITPAIDTIWIESSPI